MYSALPFSENHGNVKKILDVLNIQEHGSIETSFASDLKLSNILVGIQNHACMHCCIYCEQKTRGPGAYEEPTDGTEIPKRTIGTCKNWNQKFMQEGQGKKVNAKYYMNCVNAPILKGNDDDEILLLLPPPG